MNTQKKLNLAVRSRDAQTLRDIRQLTSAWCDVHPVQDLRSIESVCMENPRMRMTPFAIIVDSSPCPSALPAKEELAADKVLEFLAEVRDIYPTMRRVLIANDEDLSMAIQGLHSGVIDSLLNKPFDTARILTALRAQKVSAAHPVQGATRAA